jgi:hypothetical protein
MSSLERRLVFFGMALLFLAGAILAASGGRFPTSIAQASPRIPNCVPLSDGHCYGLAYYGADNGSGGGMYVATGVQPGQGNADPTNAPWPQYQNNYCFLAVLQAIANYELWKVGASPTFPSQPNQGPPSGNPADETLTPQNVLYEMDHYMQPTFGTISPVYNVGAHNQHPFTLADSSYDFGGDPRAQAYAAWYLTPDQHMYHQYIYHAGNVTVDTAAYGLAKGVSYDFGDASYRGIAGYSPEIAVVDHGLHSVIIAGVWSYGNAASLPDAIIDSFAVYNPWEQTTSQQHPWGGPLYNGAYYERVSFSNWTSTTTPSDFVAPGTWWGQTYSSNSGADPDPVIGIYAPAPGQHHWIGNWVSIQRDNDWSGDNANYCHDENGNVMYGP